MKVFISWSGEQTRGLAVALEAFIRLAFASHVETFVSDTDIAPGERFLAVINENLDAADIGVLLVTRANMNSPWLLFEAGALAGKSSRGSVIPLLVDIERAELSPPLSQFQNLLAASKDSIVQLCGRIRDEAADGPNDAAFEVLMAAALPALEQALATAAAPASATPHRPQRDEREILNEILLSVNSLVRRDASVAAFDDLGWGSAPAVRDDGDLILVPGQTIQHKEFGGGTVVAVTGQGRKQVAHVKFEKLGLKKLLVHIAPIIVTS